MSASPYIVDVTAETFMSEVIEKSSQIPVLVDFWADWCGPCKSLMPILAKLADEYAGGFMLAKVDTDAEQMIASQMGIRSLPTVVLFHHGQPVDQFQGALPEGQVREFLNKHIDATPQDPSAGVMEQIKSAIAQGQYDIAGDALNQLLENDANDVDAKILLGELKFMLGETDTAKQLLESLDDDAAKKSEYKALAAKLAFSEMDNSDQSVDQLEALVSQNQNDHESRYALGIKLVMQGDVEAAMQHLLEIVNIDREFRQDGARKLLVQIFDLLGGSDPLTSKYRGLLARTLN